MLEQRNVGLYRSRPTPFHIYIHTDTQRIGIPNHPRHPFPPLQNDTFLQLLAIRNDKKKGLSHCHGESPPDLPFLLSILLVAACLCGQRADSFYANTRTLPTSLFPAMHKKEKRPPVSGWAKTQWFGFLRSVIVRASFSSFSVVNRWVWFDFSSKSVCLPSICKLTSDKPHGVFLRRPR